MEQWQSLMAYGNDSFDSQAWHDAEHYYYQAESLIAQQWQDDIENVELLLAWVASLHNLAALFEAQGQPQTALRYLTLPHYQLMSLFKKNQISAEFEATIYRAIKVTLQPLLEFSRHYPICDSCLAHLQTTKEWLLTPASSLH